MQARRRLLALLCLSLAGCYHANVETGRAPGNQQIEKGWASAYLGGMIAPAPVDTRACPNGISRVETQHSFLNGLVGVFTLSIYTPMSITVTCAAAPTALSLPPVQRDSRPAPLPASQAKRTASAK